MRRYTEARAAKDWEKVLDAMDYDVRAPIGTAWVCPGCGRRTVRTRANFRDSSCMPHAVLVHAKKRRYGHVAVMSDSAVAQRILHWLRGLVAYDRLRAEMDEELLFFRKRGGI